MGMFSTNNIISEDTGLNNPDELMGYFIVDEVSLPWEEIPLPIQKAIKELSDLVVIYGAEVVYDY